MKREYDYIVVGSGLYGSIISHELNRMGYRCLVLEKRAHIGGNIYTESVEGIDVHKYGAHIFHTDRERVWKYINQFADFNNFINSPVANYQGKIYNLPFNMNTFSKMWGISTPDEAREIIEYQKSMENITNPSNLKEQAISLVGRDIFEKLIRGYTEKQWGRKCEELPAFIIKRLPVRFTYDNNYFNSRYQGIPVNGYTAIIEKLLEGVEVRLNIDFLEEREYWKSKAEKIIYTGPIDGYFDYIYGPLEYRKVRFDTKIMEKENFQGNAVVNYTDSETPYTRIIEHKLFNYKPSDKTVISYEYSDEWEKGDEPYYPVNDERNSDLYSRYKLLAENENCVHFGGRLGEYRYFDMDVTVESALSFIDSMGDRDEI